MKIKTYLPVFPGFYNTVLEPNNEDIEVDEINRIRESEGLEPIGYEDCQWNYKEYFEQIAEQCTEVIEKELQDIGMIQSIKFEELYSPKFYNFSNDSVNIEIELSEDNIKTIREYLISELGAFQVYLKENYKSCDGFISGYSYDSADWIYDFEHEHKLGSVLNFILLDNEFDEYALFDLLTDTYICASNYSELTGE